jgi:signal transduction histidine kinase
MIRSWGLAVAAVAGVVLTGAAITVALSDLTGDPAQPQDLLPALVAAAALCVAGLLRRRSPSGAWLATIVALAIATLSIAAWGRSSRPALDASSWTLTVIAVCVGALFASGSAVLYATEPSRTPARWVAIAGAIAMGLVVATCVWVVATRGPTASLATAPLGNLVLVTRALVAVVVAFALVGIIGDLRPAGQRTIARLGDLQIAPRGILGWLTLAAEATRIFVDELAPGGQRARRAAGLERSRIAIELHADVVPVVRQALREAEQGGSPERLAVALRDVLAQVDGLALDRSSVALDALGLLPAIEWLAERTEERSAVRVSIDVVELTHLATVDRAVSDERPPREVEAAAYRVVQLALENVVRHAPSATASIQVSAEPYRVQVSIRDDGPGIGLDAGGLAVASGRRGLADMRAAAAGCGASLLAGPVQGGVGTIVRFAWPLD